MGCRVEEAKKMKIMVTMKIFCHLLLCFTISTICLFDTTHCLKCRNHLKAVEGAPMEVLCQSMEQIDSCTFDFPGFKKIKAYAGVKNQYYEFVGNYKTGECGIRFPAMKQELEGQVTVEVTFPDEDAPAEAEINVTMLHPPENCLVESNGNNFDFNEGDEMIFSCFCSKSNPLPNVSLRIGDDKSSFVSNQTSTSASKTAEISDFDKKVVCVVHHPLLGDQGFTYSRPLTILHMPKYISRSIHKVGENICIYMTVSAYPKPHAYSWTRNNRNNLILENSWLTLVKDKRCIWEVGVNVSEITNDDLEHGFEWKIANSEGRYSTIVIPEAKKDQLMITVVLIALIMFACFFCTLLFSLRTEIFCGETFIRRNCSQPPTHWCDDIATSRKTLTSDECEKLTCVHQSIEPIYSDANIAVTF